MLVKVTGAEYDDLLSAMDAECCNAEALLNNREFMAVHSYLKPALNRHIEICRNFQNKLREGMAEQVPLTKGNIQW